MTDVRQNSSRSTGKKSDHEWSFLQKFQLVAGSVVIIAAVYMSFKYLFPILSPFVIAYLLALLIERPVERFSKMLWGRKILASSIIMLALTTVLFGLVGYLLYMGACEVKAFVTHFDYYAIVVKQGAARICLDMDGWFGLTDGCCLEFISKYADKCAGALTGDEGSAVMERVMSISVPVILRCAAIMGIVIVTLMSVVYLSKVLEKVRTWRKTTVFHKEAAVITDALKGLMNVYFKIQFIIMAINATLCVIGLILIKNPYAVVIGILIGVLDALPIFGTGTVLIPWALVLLLLKHVTAAAVLMTVYVITYFVREIMESKCMGDRLGIAPFTMLMVIFIGLMVYGIMGFILGPVSYCIIKALITYLKQVMDSREYRENGHV